MGADAVTGFRESSRKHKYKIAVIQECLGALWQQRDKGSSQHSTQDKAPGKCLDLWELSAVEEAGVFDISNNNWM